MTKITKRRKKSFRKFELLLNRKLRRLKNLILKYIKIIKRKNYDTMLIIIGIVVVAIGLNWSIQILNLIFSWFILFGCLIKLYTYTEKIEQNIGYYDFGYDHNKLLTAPKKDNK